MKRYMLFAFETYYPAGGSGDVRGEYDTLDEAKEYAAKNLYETIEVLDMVERLWITLKD